MADIPTLSEYIQRRKGPCCPRCGQRKIPKPMESRNACIGRTLSGQADSPCGFRFCGGGEWGGCGFLYAMDFDTKIAREPTAAEVAWIKQSAERIERIQRRRKQIFDREGLHG